jgi:hypothetical protein
VGLAVGAAFLTAPLGVRAEPYRLRADAYAGTTPAAGLVTLSAEAREGSTVDAEALVWTGGIEDRYGDDVMGEAVIASIRLRHPSGRGDVRMGRLIYTGGAVRPLHLDGLVLTGRAPFGSTLELFGGLPVHAAYEGRSYDWIVGQRFSQRVEDAAVVGVSYLQERDTGAIAREELGLDALVMPTRWLDASGKLALDVFRPGIADGRVAVAAHGELGRAEIFVLRRSPSRILPATSLFAAIGDVPSDRLGTTAFWRAAPRLDISATAAIESLGGDLGGDGSLRAGLRLDDEGQGEVAVEGRRRGTPDAAWTGIRAALRVPVVEDVTASTELELAIPDDPAGRGAVWPWGLFAMSYWPIHALEAAAAIEASSSPEYQAALSGLFRLTGRWDQP